MLMATPRTRPKSNTSYLAGEYFVAAEPYKRSYSAAMTLGNAKAIDFFVERRLRTASVQVKAIRLKRDVRWPILKIRAPSGPARKGVRPSLGYARRR